MPHLFFPRLYISYFQFILTAAHCVAWGREILNSKIVVGIHNIDVKNPKVTEHSVRRVKYHIKYNKETTDAGKYLLHAIDSKE